MFFRRRSRRAGRHGRRSHVDGRGDEDGRVLSGVDIRLLSPVACCDASFYFVNNLISDEVKSCSRVFIKEIAVREVAFRIYRVNKEAVSLSSAATHYVSTILDI